MKCLSSPLVLILVSRWTIQALLVFAYYRWNVWSSDLQQAVRGLHKSGPPIRFPVPFFPRAGFEDTLTGYLNTFGNEKVSQRFVAVTSAKGAGKTSALLHYFRKLIQDPVGFFPLH